MVRKEAIIFIVDTNHSMAVPYQKNNDNEFAKSESTRLSAAKEAILQKISTMAWQSTMHEIGVVVVNTQHTHHHLYSTNTMDISEFFTSHKAIKRDEGNDVPFPNMIELDLTRPNHYMLSTIQSIQPTPIAVKTPKTDFCQALILAADTLYRRTSGKNYRRSIVLFTDAEHEVEIDGERLECMLNGFKMMDVNLDVVGFGFFKEGMFLKQEDNLEGKEDDENNTGVYDKEEDFDLSTYDDEKDHFKMEHEEKEKEGAGALIEAKFQDLQMLIKRENEKFLLSLAQQTGGCVIATNGQNIASLLETSYAKRSYSNNGSAVRSKCEFRITPNLTVEARYSKIINQKSLPSLKRDAYLLDKITGHPMIDGGGEFMTTPIDSIIFHTLTTNPDNLDEAMIEVPQESRTEAYRFGSDLIPIGEMDVAGINSAFKSPKSVEIIGYIHSSTVIQSGLTLGPAYALFGGKESKRSMAVIAALAEAMNEKGLWAFCRFVKSANGEPKIAVLVPQKVQCIKSIKWYMSLLQLPFGDDVNYLKPPDVPKDHKGNDKECIVCDDLIDSLLVEDNKLDSKTIHFPALQSYQRMIAHFAIHPITNDKERKEGLSEERIVEASRPSPMCELISVKINSKKASNQVDSFMATFPLTKNDTEAKTRDRKYWGDGT